MILIIFNILILSDNIGRMFNQCLKTNIRKNILGNIGPIFVTNVPMFTQPYNVGPMLVQGIFAAWAQAASMHWPMLGQCLEYQSLTLENESWAKLNFWTLYPMLQYS